MTDERPRVNRPALAADKLVEEPPRPVYESAELIWIDDEINDERNGCYHEHYISHGISSPAPESQSRLSSFEMSHANRSISQSVKSNGTHRGK
jgi:hypothetical protein